MIEVVVLGGAGLLCWSLVEYGIHGALSHRLRTPVSPLHWGHHREPRAVFTSPIAWMPVAALVWALAATIAGPWHGAAFTAGLLAGFGRYEYVHWRIHFREPRTARQRLLREHHYAHHFVRPQAYHGVTTRLWDHVFGSLPPTWRNDYARVAARPPLSGPSNLRATWSPRIVVARVREQLRSTETGPSGH